MLTYLLRPFAFLTVRHVSRIHLLVCWVLPVAVSISTVLIVWLLGLRVDTFGANGVVSRVLGFVQNLPGFYIAALAAIATFANADMDQLMPGVPPTMKIVQNGAYVENKLTRRRFLSAMFSYLTALCIVITLLSVAALGIAEPIRAAIAAAVHGCAKLLFAVVYLALLFQMVFVTFWGLFYLGERLHTPN